jgi:large conductance mechanosensitive channel
MPIIKLPPDELGHDHGFVDFVRRQGVIGLAIGFILGGAVTKVVSAFVSDIINPLLGLVWGATGELKEATFFIGSAEVRWGDFVSSVIDFLIIAVIVYYGFKGLGLERLDTRKTK